MTSAAICYHPKSHQAGGGESFSSEPGIDILMPHHSGLYIISLHLVGLARPQMIIPPLHLECHRGARISGAVASRTIGLGVS